METLITEVQKLYDSVEITLSESQQRMLLAAEKGRRTTAQLAQADSPQQFVK